MGPCLFVFIYVNTLYFENSKDPEKISLNSQFGKTILIFVN